MGDPSEPRWLQRARQNAGTVGAEVDEAPAGGVAWQLTTAGPCVSLLVLVFTTTDLYRFTRLDD